MCPSRDCIRTSNCPSDESATDDALLFVQKWKAPYPNAIVGDHHNRAGNEIALDVIEMSEQQRGLVISRSTVAGPEQDH